MKIKGRMLSGALVEVGISNELITSITPLNATDESEAARYLLPGFIELQLNGYKGIDFNHPATTSAQIGEAIREVRKTGVTALCPTIITGSATHVEECIRNIVSAIETDPVVARVVIGLHIEGPYISPEDGPRGAHPRDDVRAPNFAEFERWQNISGERIKILTLSPEWPGAEEFISRVASTGVVVAIGHTAATPEQIAAAAAAGARMSTHLGNGSHARIDRHQNYIWAQLSNDQLWASFIIDGHHLPPAVVKCMIRAKTIEKSIIVTDAIAAAGLPPGRHYLGNVEVEVLESRRVNLPGTPYLAGSVIDMNDSIAKAVSYAGLSLADAVRMATLNPAQALRIEKHFGSIEVGKRADILAASWDPMRMRLDVEPVTV
ncbi:MAG: N-acetylglucosamine-6-phosphate deacetylase [Acidobacteria bacterium]|nr:N-acetylglucosamine-6-phosphate deacetylase [Acidobacteriota bacterium]